MSRIEQKMSESDEVGGEEEEEKKNSRVEEFKYLTKSGPSFARGQRSSSPKPEEEGGSSHGPVILMGPSDGHVIEELWNRGRYGGRGPQPIALTRRF